MKGTEKQIAYARNIINNTVSKINNVIANGEKVIARNESTGCQDAANRKRLDMWKECLEYMTTMEDEVESAAEIIDYEKEVGWFEYLNLSVSDECGGSSIC